MNQVRLGGSFAPPLTSELIAKYRNIAAQTGNAEGEAMRKLCDMADHFHLTPESKLPGTAHPSGMGKVVPLEQEEITRIWDHVPWPYECDAIGVLFDKLTGESRAAAYHLLWYARELAADREPITTDRL